MAKGNVGERTDSGATATASAQVRTTVCVVTTDDSVVHALAALLGEDRYQLTAVRHPSSLGGHLLDRRTDAVLFDLRLSAGLQAAVSQHVGGVPKRPIIPLVGLCSAGLSARARLSALQDGLWDVIELPAGSAELVAKLGRWVSLKRDIDGLRSSSLLDVETGHYTSQGIKRRLRELTALAQRTNDSLSCIVFGPDRLADGKSVNTEAVLEAGREFSLALHHKTRNSDVIGRLEPVKFLVLAPNTPAPGAVRLAERFTSFSLSRLVAGDAAVTFSAGVAGVEGRNGQVQACPELLLSAAERALNQARSAGAAQVAAAWGNV
jgi:GGDEF domain-containing protein